MTDVALLVLRATLGTLVAGHGAQKLFGWFGGPGLRNTAAWLKSVELRPGRPWAIAAGASEFGGGILVLLGFLNPVGSLGVVSAMGMATTKAHWGRPIWTTSGGAELPVTNMAIATALMLTGPGTYSLDHALGTHLPRWVALPGLALVGASIAAGVWSGQRQRASQEAAPAGGEASRAG